MKQDLYEKRSHGTSVFPLQVYSHRDKDGFYFVSQHWHEELEWVYVDMGMIHLTIRGQSYTLETGQFAFINSGELHEIKSSGDSLHHAIVFHADFLDFSLYDACQHYFIRPITSQKLLFPAICHQLSPKIARKILEYMQSIVKLYHILPKCAFLSIKLNLLHILELLFESDIFYENTSTEKEKELIDRLKKVITYIQDNYMNSISLQTLADMNYMSPNYFCSFFHKEIGKSPITFINEFRIQKAAQLLANTELSISQIATSVGFDNFSYFIRKFREYKGVTPKIYRSYTKSLL